MQISKKKKTLSETAEFIEKARHTSVVVEYKEKAKTKALTLPERMARLEKLAGVYDVSAEEA